MRIVLRVLPGLIVTLLTAAAARMLHGLLPASAGAVLGEVVVAVLLGLVLGNTVPIPTPFAPGIRLSFHTLLRVAIVLLGAQFSLQQVMAIGGKALVMILLLMCLALVVAHALARATGVPGRLATLIGVGTAVCGNTAITATAPVIRAEDEEVSFAIATNTLFGTLAVFLYPAFGHWMGLSDASFGTWAGTAVNDTSQVVAAGFAFSDGAGNVATAVKLTRNALMGGVIVVIGFLYSRGRAGGHGGGPSGGGSNGGNTSGGGSNGGNTSGGSVWLRIRQSVPAFVLGFLLMTLLNTLGGVTRAGAFVGRDLQHDSQVISRFLILVALAGVGWSTRISAMRRIGLTPLLVGFATATTTSVASLLLIQWLGPAGG